MKLFKSLTAVTIALFATIANANTTNVTTVTLTKVQPINSMELIKLVETDLASSMNQINVKLTHQNLLAKQTENDNNDKLQLPKISVAAE